MFLLKSLWKVEQVLSCLQYKLIDLVKHGWRFLLLNFFMFKILLLSKVLLPPIMSLRFLFLLNAKILNAKTEWKRGSAKISFNLDSICKICNFFSIIVSRSVRVLLYVTISAKRSVLAGLTLFGRSFLGTEMSWCVL